MKLISYLLKKNKKNNIDYNTEPDQTMFNVWLNDFSSAVAYHALPHCTGSFACSFTPARAPLELPLWRFLTASAVVMMSGGVKLKIK